MDAIDPRDNVINIVATGDNPSNQEQAVLVNDETNDSLNYIPPLYQLVGKLNNNFYKISLNADGSVKGL